MADTSKIEVGVRIRQLSRQVEIGRIEPAEFANALLDWIANALGTDIRMAAEIASAVPSGVREALVEAAQRVAAGDVLGPTFRIGPGLSAGELAVVTPKLQAWASALLDQLRPE